ncbi:ATP-binding protein [uncultured Agathobaculum sp.]|uniref:ATP-binding protein n=1 Tax=uncultured Agathobaculum sp. TaxID=2048140 RepID=UPI0026124317|nr:ATP-binding protein [uncultured Agathobaculum sp.]
MRKRVFGSIFLTALVTLIVTVSLLLVAVHSGLTQDLQERLSNECNYIAAATASGDEQELQRIGSVYADRITLVDADGTVLYDNERDAVEMENHASRPEIAEALEKGVGEFSRLSDTLAEQTYYYAIRLADGTVLRVSSTADSAFGALSTASPWIVLIVLLALLVAALLASWLTHVFLEPIVTLDLHEPLKNDAYDELSPLLHRMDKQNHKIASQLGELKRRQAEFDDITARMDEGLVLFSAQGDILFANRAVRALFPKDSATGGYMTLCRDAEYIRVVEEALGGESAHGRMEKDGRVYSLTASSVAGEGQGHAAVLFVVDITEREQAERQRQEFTANVSHELKTPLTSIMGFAEIMENGIVRPEDIGRFAGKIRSEAMRLLTLIEDIIRLSRLDEGAPVPFEPVELSALCGTVRDRLTHKAAENKITLHVKGTPVTVSGQRRTLEQMIFNLADNAIAYNKTHGSVTLETGEENDAPFVRVSDTGIGIAPADQPRVFERFYRVDKSHSKQTGGTGLGLSIVKHGAALHHAQIDLHSTLGEGTEITLRFPKAE